MKLRLELEDIYTLAIAWCPRIARWPHLLEKPNSWGPAHELGHALIEPRWRWKFEAYNRCALSHCECGADQCRIFEAAAMYISRGLLCAAGCAFIAELEVHETTDYDCIEPHHFKSAKALLRKKHLWPVPRSRRGLEAALQRRLRRPQGGKLPRQRRPPPPAYGPLTMFLNTLIG